MKNVFLSVLVLAFLWQGCSGSSLDTGTPNEGELIPPPAESVTQHDKTPSEFPTSSGRFVLPEGLDLQWPLGLDPKISSTFGPRQKSSENNRPDFHRGIDIPGPLGEPILSILYPAEIYKVVAGGESSEGGNVVTLRHALPEPVLFRGKLQNEFYSTYSHLDGFGPKAQEWLNNPNSQVILSGNDVVGTVGQSGSTTFNHLHLEIRFGQCSLEYQELNKGNLLEGGACATGYDPHVHPFQFLKTDDDTPPEFKGISIMGDLLTVAVATSAENADFDYIVLQALNAEGDVILEKKLGFNSREGFDATSTEALDDPQQEGGFVDPAEFVSASTEYAISFTFDLSEAGQTPSSVRILIEDIWGNGATTMVDF